jgi:hypothetical protein
MRQRQNPLGLGFSPSEYVAAKKVAFVALGAQPPQRIASARSGKAFVLTSFQYDVSAQTPLAGRHLEPLMLIAGITRRAKVHRGEPKIDAKCC